VRVTAGVVRSATDGGVLMRRIAVFVAGAMVTGALGAAIPALPAAAQGTCGTTGVPGAHSCTYTTVGADTFTVPPGTTSVTVVAVGGGGGGGLNPGGGGAQVSTTLTVSGGQVLTLFVAGGGTEVGDGAVGGGGGSTTIDPGSGHQVIAGGGGGGAVGWTAGNGGIDAAGDGGAGTGFGGAGGAGGGGGVGGAPNGGSGNGGSGGAGMDSGSTPPTTGAGGAGGGGGGGGGTAGDVGGGGGGGFGGGGGGSVSGCCGGGGAGGSTGPAGVTSYSTAPNAGPASTNGGNGSIVISGTFTPLLSQSITFNPLPNQTSTSAPFNVASYASATSGLAVSFSSDTPAVCTVAGSIVTIVDGGTCTIRASQAGNSSYAPAADQTQSFTVTDTDLSITPGISPAPVEATGPSMSVPVAFTVPTATDEDGPVGVFCDHLSGSSFPVGSTLVTCSATGADDTPAMVSTTLTVTVYVGATKPDAPMIGTATAGNGSASATFSPPAYDGSEPVTKYTATCTSSDGGTTGSASGPYSPLTVSGLSNGATYTCTVTATNAVGMSKPSSASNPVTPTAVATCTDTQTCVATTATPTSPTNPSQTVQVTGTPTAPTGTVQVAIATAPLACPGGAIAVSKATTLTDTGFGPKATLTATVTQRAVATNPGVVCFSSAKPFRSQTNPLVPKAGTALLLACAAVANEAPCQVSSTQTNTAISVKFLIPGGDPTFSVVIPTGRLVWPSNFPAGKVGTTYASHLQSRGGKAPFHWKVVSGKLAPGLTLNGTTGAVSGTPTTKGTFACVIEATDSESPAKVADISVSVTIK